ncbi:9263_t:CDS:1, partial [Cetraspora pellucida]
LSVFDSDIIILSSRSSDELLFSLDVEDVGLIEVFKLEKIDLVL